MSVIKKIGFFSAFLLIGTYLMGYMLGGFWHFSTLVFAFLFIPLADHWVGKDANNLHDDEMKIISKAFYYRLITYLWVYVQLAVVLFGAYAVTVGSITTISEWIGFILATSIITGGIGITVAHELGHKPSKAEQFYSKILLMTVCYMHFFIEHNRGHHVKVATPDDPATSRKNENFYRFWIRSVFKGYQSAWRIEGERIRRKGKRKFGLHNQMIWYGLLPLAFCAILTSIFSFIVGTFAWQVPIYFFAQSILAFTLLEQVNYIEHYGLLRKKGSNHRYETVTHLHSWNANHLISNFFLFQLQRHSDHHQNAIRRYQALKHYDESPQLPFGYPTMIVMALFPSLWFKFMNPKLEQWQRDQFNQS